METWPTSFGLPSTNFAGAQDANSIRTTMESGVVRQRRRFTAERLVLNAKWEWNDLQMAVFIAFHKFRLNLGNDYFIMPLPLGGGVNNHVVRFLDGKFAQNYSAVSHWDVSAQLEVLERVVFSEALMSVYLDIGFDGQLINGLLVALENVHTFIHVTEPFNV